MHGQQARSLGAAVLAIAVAAAVAAAPATVGAGAGPPPQRGLVRLTGRSPLAGCRASGPTVQRGAEVESHLAVDPTDGRRLLATWQQDRDRRAAAVGTGVARSVDGGRTWRRVAVPGVTTCPAGRYRRASDPWLSIGPDGTAYLATLRVAAGRRVTTQVLVTRSGDAGATWSAPAIVANLHAFEDKETVTADPMRPGTAYAVWAHVRRGEPRLGYFSRTLDGGVTWSAPRPFYRPPRGRVANGHQIVVTAGGDLVDVFFEAGGRSRPLLRAVRSRDGGATWSAPVLVGRPAARSLIDAERRVRVRTGEPLASLAVAPDGEIFAAWQELSTPARGRIMLARSVDGGRSFQPAIPVAGARARPFLPAIAAGPAGLGLTYYDLRRDRPGDRRLTTTFWLARSRDSGRTWRAQPVGRPFDLRRAPRTGGVFFLGDYTGLVALGDRFGAAFVAAPPLARVGASDVFFVRR